MHVEIYLLCMDEWHITYYRTVILTCVCISFFLLLKTHIRPCLKMYCRSATGTGT